jgi:hypothetical protein
MVEARGARVSSMMAKHRSQTSRRMIPHGAMGGQPNG